MVRHATPDWNRRDIRYDIPPGPDLTAKGREEAYQAGLYLKPYGIDVIYASPMARATQTAEIMAETLGQPCRSEMALIEWARDESPASVLARLLDFWHSQVESGDAATLALVTHGGPIGLLIAHFQPELDLARYRGRFDHRNCAPPGGIWRAAREPGAETWRWELVFMPRVGEPGVESRERQLSLPLI